MTVRCKFIVGLGRGKGNTNALVKSYYAEEAEMISRFCVDRPREPRYLEEEKEARECLSA